MARPPARSPHRTVAIFRSFIVNLFECFIVRVESGLYGFRRAHSEVQDFKLRPGTRIRRNAQLSNAFLNHQAAWQ